MSKHLLPTLALLILGQLCATANPLTMDSRRRPITMIAEQVDIAVRPGASLVQGTYTFRQEKDDWPEERDTHVTLFVPVLEHWKFKDQTVAPKVTVNSHAIAEYHHDDLRLVDDPNFSSEGLPGRWWVRSFIYRIPLNLVKPTFTVHITYQQPNFSGNVVGYIPNRPPKDPAKAKITFHAAPGSSLKPYAARPFVQPSHQSLSFTPAHGELLRVKLFSKPPTAPVKSERVAQ